MCNLFCYDNGNRACHVTNGCGNTQVPQLLITWQGMAPCRNSSQTSSKLIKKYKHWYKYVVNHYRCCENKYCIICGPCAPLLMRICNESIFATLVQANGGTVLTAIGLHVVHIYTLWCYENILLVYLKVVINTIIHYIHTTLANTALVLLA